MKKYSLLFLVVAFANVLPVFADDTAPNVNFWIKDKVIHCISIQNAAAFQSGDEYLVFDYSKSLGVKKGKPWTIVEPGKCYEISDDGGTLYLVSEKSLHEEREEYDPNGTVYDPSTGRYIPHDKKVTYDSLGISKSQIENYAQSGIKNDADIRDVFCKPTNSSRDYINDCGGDINPRKIYSTEDKWGPSDSIYDSGIRTYNLIPTTYDIRSTHYVNSIEHNLYGYLEADSDFVYAKEKYTSLSNQLEKEVQSCDARTRIEKQMSVQKDRTVSFEKGIWLLSGNKKVVFEQNRDSFLLELLTQAERDILLQNGGLNVEGSVWIFPNGIPKQVYLLAADARKNNRYVNLSTDDYGRVYDDATTIATIGCTKTYTDFITKHANDIELINAAVEKVAKKYPKLLQGENGAGTAAYLTKKTASDLKRMQDLAAGRVSPAKETDIETNEPVDQNDTGTRLFSSNGGVDFASSPSVMKLYFLLPLFSVIGILLFLRSRKR